MSTLLLIVCVAAVTNRCSPGFPLHHVNGVVQQPSARKCSYRLVDSLLPDDNAGPSGVSVREICKLTGADLKSWTEPAAHPASRPTRTFNIEVSSTCKNVSWFPLLCSSREACSSWLAASFFSSRLRQQLLYRGGESLSGVSQTAACGHLAMHPACTGLRHILPIMYTLQQCGSSEISIRLLL